MNAGAITHRTLRLFVSYAHADEEWLKRLRPTLQLVMGDGLVEAWHDKDVAPGDSWDEKIKQELGQAEIVVCLVSTNFLASTYIKSVEMPLIIERHRLKQCVVVPVLLFPLDLRRFHPFLYQREPLPYKMKSWREIEKEGIWQDAIYPITEGLVRVVDNFDVAEP